MKIGAKILWTLLSMSLLVALVGALAVNRQRAAAMVGVTQEAENVARLLGFLLTSDRDKPADSAQTVVARLHQAQGRDVVLVDSKRIVIADAVPSETGKAFSEDPNGEVASTLRDGRTRTFVETSKDYPAGIKQIVVPVQDSSGRILGAVVLEYTPLYNELMRLTEATVQEVALAAIASAVLALLIAYYMGRSIAAPLQLLTRSAQGFAAGQSDLPMPHKRKDEIGDLAAAFAQMMQARQKAEEDLRQMRDDLEALVGIRTAELAKTNEELRKENAERGKVEQQLSIEYAISRILAESSQLDQTTLKVLQTTCEILGWDVGLFWAADHRAGAMRCGETWGSSNGQFGEFIAQSRKITFPRGVGLPGRVWAGGQAAWIGDIGLDSNFPRAPVAKQAGLRSAFAVPVLIGSGVGGVLEFFSREVREPDEALLHTCANLGSQLGQFLERRKVEDHLVQSQKMETVGKLAGGIAHEFNSIMTAIIFQSELMLADVPSGSPASKSATEIREAANRAAALTRQLLAYGRKQFLLPEILNLNAVLKGMENMVRHLLGRDVDVRFVPAADLKMVKADAGQIEQVVVNIAMNAADVMPNGGIVTFETANVTLDQDYARRFPELKAGEYVMLAISDTGPGMGDEVKARIFEPFFTTKGVGKGTGLGLATCHGIVKQSGGHIAVYSEPGRGATFKIYLPQVEQGTAAYVPRSLPTDLPHGTETVLLVEDDPALREAAAMLLGRLGYTVLTAANGVDALKMAQQEGSGHIDLLFTDVVMPHMSGKELVDRVRILFPRTKILFASAYTGNAIVHQGALDPGAELLQKPFPPALLANKVREILDRN
jgi:signal transduction histidine kinase/CheY-like chemotaxis protein